MPIEILMPALSPTMTEGNLAKWLKKEGDTVSPGEVIAEIETDKATMEVEAVDEGIIAKIIISEGTEAVKVNEVIAILIEDNEDISIIENYTISTAISNNDSASKDIISEVTEIKVAYESTFDKQSNKIFASPLAKRIAMQEGISLSEVKGTGPNNRIIKHDILEFLSNAKAGTAKDNKILDLSVNRHEEEFSKIPNNNMRKVIAKRLSESKQTVPHFYLSIECCIDQLLKIRSEINNVVNSEAPEYKISVNDLVIKAVAMALQKVPAANASWTDDAILQYNNVDISVAVAIEGGLITPIIHNADKKSLSQISNEMKDLAKRAKLGKLKPEEFQGGGFSISNLGMYGIKNFKAIVNPPQSCILAIGASSDRAIVRNGQIEIANIMDVSLSSDHRVVDGAIGAEFLSWFKKYIENPVTMLA